jgi:hypothetical protein
MRSYNLKKMTKQFYLLLIKDDGNQTEELTFSGGGKRWITPGKQTGRKNEPQSKEYIGAGDVMHTS